ncbi:LptF/LptG family permease [bacterium]|nr:LptF/LptG family permease [bacterium]
MKFNRNNFGRDREYAGRVEKRGFFATVWFCIAYFFRWLFSPNLRLMKLEKYVFTEVFGWYLLGIMGFTFFMIITSVFMLGEKIFSKKIPIYTTLKVLIVSAPAYLVLALPVAMLFATLMAMGRLSRDNEITMFVASGVSLYSIFVPFLCLALYTTLASWSIYEYLVPANNREWTKVLAVFWDSQVVEFIRPNLVIKAPDDKYFYIEEVDRDKGRMYNLRLYDYANDRPSPRLFFAEEAWVENKYLNLKNVSVIETEEKDGGIIATAVAEHTSVDISRRLGAEEYEISPQELSSADLRARIRKRQKTIGLLKKPSARLLQEHAMDLTEYYLKFSIPLASVVFVLVAVPLSLRGPRDERNLGIIQAFILIMVYYLFFFTFKMLGSIGRVPPMMAGWMPTLIFALGALVLFIRARK